MASEGDTAPGRLLVNGYLTVTNTGLGNAGIGNIVVNLQTKAGSKWVSRASNVADATQDDAATQAYIGKHASSEGFGFISESAGSGQLLFMDTHTNSFFSLVPKRVVAPGEAVNLLFSASFNNNVLRLANGTPVRAEVIVSFGNSGGNDKNSATNLDISGNGVIDADEARVRGVPARFNGTVPPSIPGNGTVMLEDTLEDITTTGTATFSNAVFNLGPTSGTVMVNYDGGASGGAITNCAHLRGSASTVTNVGPFTFPVVNGLDLQVCDTQTVEGGGVCTIPGQPGCGWKEGDVVTYTQFTWGTTGLSTLQANYNSVYASTFGVLEIGVLGAGFSILFSDYLRILTFFPELGVSGALTGDLTNPTSSSAGVLGGNVAALRLAVDFSDAGYLGVVPVGDIRYCEPGQLGHGSTVRQILGFAEDTIGGIGTGLSPSGLASLTSNINGAFDGGVPDSFGQTNLVNGACP